MAVRRVRAVKAVKKDSGSTKAQDNIAAMVANAGAGAADAAPKPAVRRVPKAAPAAKYGSSKYHVRVTTDGRGRARFGPEGNAPFATWTIELVDNGTGKAMPILGNSNIERKGHPLLNYVYLMNSLIPDLLESGLDVSVKIEGIFDSHSDRTDRASRDDFRTGQLDSAFNHGGDFSPLYGALIDMKKRPRLPIFIEGQRVLEPGYDSYRKDVGLTSVYDSIYPGIGTPFTNLNSPETQKLLEQALVKKADVDDKGRKVGFDKYDLDKLEKLLEAKNNALFAGYEHIRTPEGETISIPSRDMIRQYDVISDSLATLWARFMKGIRAADRKARKATQLTSQMLGDEDSLAAIAQTNAVLGNFRDWAERNVPEIVPKLDKAWREYRVPEWTLDDEGRERLNSNMEKLIGNMLGHYNEYAKEKSRIHGLSQSVDPTEIGHANLDRLDNADNVLQIGPDEFRHVYDRLFSHIRNPFRGVVHDVAPYFGEALFVEDPERKDSMGRPKYMLAPGAAKYVKTMDASGKETWNHPLLRSLALRAMLDWVGMHPDEDLREYGRNLFDTKGLSLALANSGDEAAKAKLEAMSDVEDMFFNLLVDRNNPRLRWVRGVGYVFQPPKRIEDMTEEEYNRARNAALGKE